MDRAAGASRVGAAARAAGPVTGPGGDKPDALLLDEMFSPAIADGLASRGIDCRAVVADALLRALSDLEIFEAALLEGWVIVTNNVPAPRAAAGHVTASRGGVLWLRPSG